MKAFPENGAPRPSRFVITSLCNVYNIVSIYTQKFSTDVVLFLSLPMTISLLPVDIFLEFFLYVGIVVWVYALYEYVHCINICPLMTMKYLFRIICGKKPLRGFNHRVSCFIHLHRKNCWLCKMALLYAYMHVYLISNGISLLFSSDEIVQKINHILDSRVSPIRSEYLANKQKKQRERMAKRHWIFEKTQCLQCTIRIATVHSGVNFNEILCFKHDQICHGDIWPSYDTRHTVVSNLTQWQWPHETINYSTQLYEYW